MLCPLLQLALGLTLVPFVNMNEWGELGSAQLSVSFIIMMPRPAGQRATIVSIVMPISI